MYRVIWKYGPDRVGYPTDELPSSPSLAESAQPLLQDLPVTAPAEPVFRIHPFALRAEQARLPEALREDPDLDLVGYFHTFVETREAAEALANRLREDGVLHAEVQGEPSTPVWRRFQPPPPSPGAIAFALPPQASQSWQHLQGYLDPAPSGVDARFAWALAGGDGSGINIVDIEVDWDFGHEDLLHRLIGKLYGPDGEREDHGTAVLGILGGDANGFGVTGIAHGAYNSTAATGWNGQHWELEDAIVNVALRLNPGSVILIEQQAGGPLWDSDQDLDFGLLPVEYWSVGYDAIRHATARGIVVVEAAGNGSQHLDNALYGNTFVRAVRDSGAILVCAGTRGDHSRLPFSNHGARVDVQGWGEQVTTCGGRREAIYCDLTPHADASRCYTGSFSGTSSASAIVAGVAACINGRLKHLGRPLLDSVAMRNLLSATGTPQGGAAAGENIGPLPDLRAALLHLGAG